MKRIHHLFVALMLPAGRPAIEIQGFHLVESKLEEKTIEIWAKSARVYKPEDLMALDSMVTDLWSSSSDEPYRLSGVLGVLDSNTQDFKVFNDSEIQSPDGYLFKTTNVRFLSGPKLIQTDEAVEAKPLNAENQGFIINGVGLEINTVNSAYYIHKTVKAIQKLNSSKDKGLQILSDSATIEPRQNLASFFKNVAVRSPELDLKGQRLIVRFAVPPTGSAKQSMNQIENMKLDSPGALSSKRIKATIRDLNVEAEGLEVKFDESGGFKRSEAIGSAEGKTNDGVYLWAEHLVSEQIKGETKIFLKDKVKIITNGRNATCEEAVFTPSTGEILLERSAIVKKDTQVVEGERVRLSTKNSELKVEKARGTIDKKDILPEKSS